MARTIPPERMRVPPDRIPQFSPACTKCGSGVRTIHSLPMADYYMRRHRCINTDCRATFYSMAFYESDKRIVTRQVPKDRALTHDEIAQRKRWWSEYEERGAAQEVVVTPDGNPVREEPAVLAAISLALATPNAARTPLQAFIAEMVEAIQTEIDAHGTPAADGTGTQEVAAPAVSGEDEELRHDVRGDDEPERASAGGEPDFFSLFGPAGLPD